MYLAHHLIQLWYVDMLTQFVLCVVKERFCLHFFCTWTVVGLCTGCVFLFLYFFVHFCICIISLSCKGGQRWWVFVPLWQPASDIFCMLVLILRRINMMMMMILNRRRQAHADVSLVVWFGLFIHQFTSRLTNAVSQETYSLKRTKQRCYVWNTTEQGILCVMRHYVISLHCIMS